MTFMSRTLRKRDDDDVQEDAFSLLLYDPRDAVRFDFCYDYYEIELR